MTTTSAMFHSFWRTAHGFLKRHQDQLSRRRRDHPGRQLAEIVARARTLGIPRGPRLDIGGGEGNYRGLLSDGDGDVLELDRFPGPQVDLVADAHHLPIRDGVAGLTLLAEVLEHLAEPALAINECYRALQPGGMLVITTPQYWHVHGHPSDFYRFTDAGLRHLCASAGFTVIDCWSRGGPVLILFHVIRVNLSERWRPLFVLPFYALAEWIDRLTYDRRPTGTHYDALGWSLLARKP
ncbi:MAG: class I SAM-dependent methyltransferase [Nitrospirae bacterium]|nr:class I SAM-dependent methyltransferase [Nitrospirota bacterium]